ncbi:glutathione S-transferase D7 [Condylostylus longicornis]|uniref:glutathione S-transferase D7 n=1 Tax=Condylostylus longicornis TaxID=2530218 RepID=UPI00244D9A72|nr:glutathione S-transferase D7 [Condylostylus longicornis]
MIKFIKVCLRGGQMPPILYYIKPSPPCRAILLLGRILELEFDLKQVNIMEKEHMKPEFLNMNPQHCLPTINDSGLVLWESRAILAYLVAAYGKDDSLYPADIRTRALIDQRLQFDLGTLYQRTTDFFWPTIFMGAPLDETKKAKLAEALYWLDTILKGRTFLATDNFTIADLSLTVTVSQIEVLGFQMGPYPRVRAWLQKCKDYLEPYGYDEINQTGADILAEMYFSKLQKTGN